MTITEVQKQNELLESIWFYINTYPESYNQASWRKVKDHACATSDAKTNRCGTTYCVGGWAVALGTDGDVKWLTDDMDEPYSNYLHPVESDAGTDIVVAQLPALHKWSEMRYVPAVSTNRRAKRLLGLPHDPNYPDHMPALFESSNSLEDIREFIENRLGRPVTGRNPVLLRRTLDHVTALYESGGNGENWNQAVYRSVDAEQCKTSMCFAGWACDDEGGTWVGMSEMLLAEPGDRPLDLLPARELAKHASWRTRDAFKELGDKKVIRAELRAKHLLGVSNAEASALFGGANTLHDLERYVNNLCAGRHVYA